MKCNRPSNDIRRVMNRMIGTSINNIFHIRNVLVIDLFKGEIGETIIYNIFPKKVKNEIGIFEINKGIINM
jgi:hypothetical protein